MLPKKIETAMNKQINHEFYSAYLYLSMSAYFQELNLEGFAHWTRVQAQEEQSHALKFFDHILERGGAPRLETIDGPQAAWKSPLEACQAILKHEQFISKCINDLMDLSRTQKDHASGSLLQWFVDEQVEEEANAGLLLERMKMVKDSPGPLLMLDRQLAERKSEED
jgi:ferritin